jgi:hypothetical protein
MKVLTRGLKARIVEPEETAVAREWLCKRVSMATNSCDHGNIRNRAVGSGVFYVVRPKAITSTPAEFKQMPGLGVQLGHSVSGGYKYRDLALEVGETLNLRQ